MAESTTTLATLTAEQVNTILLKPLEAKSLAFQSGAQIIDTDGSQVRLPSLATVGTPSWVGENELIPETALEDGEITLLPAGMKSLKTITRFSNELSRQSVVALDSAIQSRLVKDVADAFDSHVMGVGGDGITVPQGVFGYAGVQTVDAGASLSVDALHDANGAALATGLNNGSLKWVLNPADFTALQKVKTTDGNYLIQSNVREGVGYVLLGLPVVVTRYAPVGTSALVDFSQVAIARDVAPAVKILDQTFGDYDQMGIRVVWRADMKPLNSEAIVKITTTAV